MNTRVLNPNHPVMRAAEDHWFKIAALLLLKLPRAEAVITPADILALENHFDGEMPTIVLNDRKEGLHVYFITATEVDVLAREAGGLPQ